MRAFCARYIEGSEWNRGAYLAEALAHCGECHTPRNLAFALNSRKKFDGAVAAGWRAFNISSTRAPALVLGVMTILFRT